VNIFKINDYFERRDPYDLESNFIFHKIRAFFLFVREARKMIKAVSVI
jgi:hypothetical protein